MESIGFPHRTVQLTILTQLTGAFNVGNGRMILKIIIHIHPLPAFPTFRTSEPGLFKKKMAVFVGKIMRTNANRI